MHDPNTRVYGLDQCNDGSMRTRSYGSYQNAYQCYEVMHYETENDVPSIFGVCCSSNPSFHGLVATTRSARLALVARVPVSSLDSRVLVIVPRLQDSVHDEFTIHIEPTRDIQRTHPTCSREGRDQLPNECACAHQLLGVLDSYAFP